MSCHVSDPLAVVVVRVTNARVRDLLLCLLLGSTPRLLYFWCRTFPAFSLSYFRSESFLLFLHECVMSHVSRAPKRGRLVIFRGVCDTDTDGHDAYARTFKINLLLPYFSRWWVFSSSGLSQRAIFLPLFSQWAAARVFYVTKARPRR